MTEAPTLELDAGHLRSWIGREDVATDVVSADLVAKFNATFDVAGLAPGAGDIAPRFIHFCLTQAIAPMSQLGRDGHPQRGGVLPPVPLPRRMRAGGSVNFHDDLRVGDEIRRTARIADVAVKQGKSGALCFVTVENRVEVDGRRILTETEDIVYRADGPAGPAGPGRTPPPAPPGTWSRPQPVSTTLLFRYSAITFNGHRIHYDRRYAMEVEGYPGLVVHGPIQTTLLYRYATELRGTPPARFRFRSLSPLFDDDAVALRAEETEGGGLKLWTARDGGPIATVGEAEWD
jgi:3-methylfumaryl-CoA hydratase